MLSEKMRSIRGEMADIESLMDIMGKARGLILNMAPNAMGLEQISSLDECMKVGFFFFRVLMERLLDSATASSKTYRKCLY